MKAQLFEDTLRISDVKELDASNANNFRDEVRSAFASSPRHMEIDLSQTAFVDSCGLGALIALHKTACDRNGTLRLLNPQPAVEQILQLTRLHRVFEVIKR